jgi:TonB family protein
MYQTREKPTVRIAEFSSRWEGRTIEDGFSLRQFLGGGESSAVFLTARDGRDAAIKLIAADPQTAYAHLARLRESARLSHPNLIRILATGRCELDEIPLLYIVMERAEEDLSQVLPDRSLTAVEAREMLQPALDALGYIHSQGFVHARLKPSNVMAVDDCLKISSDGILRPDAAKEPGAATPYDPPERVPSASGDVWSLGITLVEVLTQRLPAGGNVPPDLPEPFAGIARGCLQENPANRFTIAQISNLLGPSARPVPLRKKRVAPLGLWILLALVLVIVAGVIFMHSETGAPAGPHPTQTVKMPEPATPTPAPQPKQLSKAAKPPEPEKKVEKEPPEAEPESSGPVTGIIEQHPPEITDQARSTIRGKVKFTVRVDVSPSGTVTDAKLEPGASKYFGERALEAVRRWKFEPVSVNGSEVGQRWRIRFEFVRNGTKVQPQRISP